MQASPTTLTESTVREGLRALRYAKPLDESPLVNLALVDRRLRDEGLDDSIAAREWVLHRLIEDVVDEALQRLRGRSSTVETTSSIPPAEFLDRLEEDFRDGDIDLEAWGVLCLRHVVGSRTPNDQVADRLGITKRTLIRRLGRGYRLMADELRRREQDLEQGPSEDLSAPPDSSPGSEPASAAESDAASDSDTSPGTASEAESSARADAEPLAPSVTEEADRGEPVRDDPVGRSLAPSEKGAESGRLSTLAPSLAVVRQAVLAGPGALAEVSRGILVDALRQTPTDVDALRLNRIAEWSLPRHRLEARFVEMSVLLDEGADLEGRWRTKRGRFSDLAAVLQALPDPAVVILGRPGAGKTTLLRHLELQTAIAGIRNDPSWGALEGAERMVPLLVPLAAYDPSLSSAGRASDWLEGLWERRYARMPPLRDFIADGRVLLLLDGLNEMPAQGRDLGTLIGHWKQFLLDEFPATGNRAVFTCRSLDYSATLSTPELRVPQVVIEPLTDERMLAFLERYVPERAEAVWDTLRGATQRDLFRTPFLLRLVADHFAQVGVSKGRAAARSDTSLEGSVSPDEGSGEPEISEAHLSEPALITSFVRRALLREIERDHPALAAEGVLDRRDVQRVLAGGGWPDPYELPERGDLFSGLSGLGLAMQLGQGGGEVAQVRVLYDEALDAIDAARPEAVLDAGLALGLLDEDRRQDEVFFFHQLAQEYFAARRLAHAPRPELTRAVWKAEDTGLADALAGLGRGERLPAAPASGWEVSFEYAAAMSADPSSFISAVARHNLVAAARCARQPDVLPRLADGLLDELRSGLLQRSRHPDADLRHRVECGNLLGTLGDPRTEPVHGESGPFVVPELAELPGGHYLIGSDTPLRWRHNAWTDHMPAHQVRLDPFGIGRYAVTNREWACFMAADGYEDERWWQTEAARAWRAGEGTQAAARENNRMWRSAFRSDPGQIDTFVETGTFDEEAAERWRRWIALSDAAFEKELARRWPDRPLRSPRFWADSRLSGAALPVVGISWYEACAYCAWLAFQTGSPYRLPTEAEWEAAARGMDGRAFPYGNDWDPLAGNTVDAHLLEPAPVGVFPRGYSPEGVADLVGNTWDWTLSAWGEQEADGVRSAYGYPYDPTDGREALDTPASVQRVARGGAWNGPAIGAWPVNRNPRVPGHRPDDFGLRVAMRL